MAAAQLLHSDAQSNRAAFRSNYDNQDWNVEAGAFYYDGNVDLNAPADELVFAFSDQYNPTVSYPLRFMFAIAVKDCDPSIDGNALIEWMEREHADGDFFTLAGACVAEKHENGFWNYSLIRTGL